MKHVQALAAGLAGVVILVVAAIWLTSQRADAPNPGQRLVSPRPEPVAPGAVAAPQTPVPQRGFPSPPRDAARFGAKPPPHQLPASTKDKQGSFTLLKAVHGELSSLPNGQGASSALPGLADPACTVVWKAPDGTSSMDLFHHRVVLTASTGEQEALPLSLNAPTQGVKEGKEAFVLARIPYGYGPQFEHSTIAIFKNDRELGHWKLQPLPKPRRCIADGEPTVLTNKLGPFTMSVSPVRAACNYSPSPAIDMQIRFEGKPQPNKEYVFWPRLGRTTWSNELSTSWTCGTGSVNMQGLGYQPVVSFAQGMEKVEFLAKLTEYRVHKEEVRVSGLKLGWAKPNPNLLPANKPRLEIVPSGKPFEAVTRSGVRLTLAIPELMVQPNGHGAYAEVRLDVNPSEAIVMLPKSPLCRSTGKPVELLCRVAPSDGATVSPGASAPGKAGFYIQLLPEQMKPGPLPSVGITVTQRVQVGEYTARFLGPLVDKSGAQANGYAR